MARVVAITYDEKPGDFADGFLGEIELEGYPTECLRVGYNVLAEIVGKGGYPHGYPWYISEIRYLPNPEKDDHSRMRLLVARKPPRRHAGQPMEARRDRDVH